MTKIDFARWNKILGWLVFLIALATYSLTVEPTASFWDAGEYISTSSKLEVGHPPGAPFYQMVGAFFSTFASDAQHVALLVNLVSAVASAFTILFMFWSIVLLLLKMLRPLEELNTGEKIAILGSAMVGALAFSFTDSFWFNAVEAEVYAMATCILSVMFYLALLWERDMFKPRGNRWIILISLVIGLSFGVHFMGLLTIPAIGFLYFFKNYEKITIKNFIVANIVVVAVLMFIFKFLLPYTLTFFSVSELFFVNSIGLPFNSGTIIAGLLIIAIFYYGIKYTRRKHYYQLNTLLLCIMFILIGFSSWIMLPIRANAPTVINENNPDNARALLAYYDREQYGESYLLYGPQFTEIYGGLDEANPYRDEEPKYEKDEALGKYVIVNNYKNATQNTDDAQKAFFPRMWSTQHAANYMEFTGSLDFHIKAEYAGQEQLVSAVNEFRKAYNQGNVDNDQYDAFLQQFREYITVEKPSFLSNINYLFEFQIGYMYWRYFMWNFVGRQDDIQGKYDDLHGNWLSGIKFIDEARLGSQENLPSDVKNNKARNTYYFLPFLLGLIGMIFHFNKDKKRFWVLLVFFLFTGIALKIYLNERPFEPRERDYALVGSFFVFAIWIGFGVYALFDLLREYLRPRILAPVVTVVGLLVAPVLLASQNWDDHDRSNKYTATAMAKMYLDSVDENGILFTIGDNDTFALWYAQEIEGYRTDIRIINTSLFATDWYIDQMRRKAWESDPVPGQLTHKQYRTGTNDAVWYQPIPTDSTMQIKTWLNWIASDNPKTQAELMSGQTANTFPTKNIRIPVEKENVLKYGIVKPENANSIVDHIDIELSGDIIYKNRLLMLDIVANNHWKRPIYFTGGSFGNDDYLWMKDYLQLEGVAYKLVPIKTPVDPKAPYEMGRIDTDKMYDIVTGWDWGNMGSSKIYHDPETRKNTITYRSNLARLVEELLKEGKYDKAEVILDLAMENMPVGYFGYYFLLEPYISGYYEIGQTEKAREIWNQVATKYQEYLYYYSTLNLDRQYRYASEILTYIQHYRNLVDILLVKQDRDIIDKKVEEFNDYIKLFPAFYQDEDTPKDGVPNLKKELNQPKSIDSLDSMY